MRNRDLLAGRFAVGLAIVGLCAASFGITRKEALQAAKDCVRKLDPKASPNVLDGAIKLETGRLPPRGKTRAFMLHHFPYKISLDFATGRLIEYDNWSVLKRFKDEEVGIDLNRKGTLFFKSTQDIKAYCQERITSLGYKLTGHEAVLNQPMLNELGNFSKSQISGRFYVEAEGLKKTAHYIALTLDALTGDIAYFYLVDRFLPPLPPGVLPREMIAELAAMESGMDVTPDMVEDPDYAKYNPIFAISDRGRKAAEQEEKLLVYRVRQQYFSHNLILWYSAKDGELLARAEDAIGTLTPGRNPPDSTIPWKRKGNPRPTLIPYILGTVAGFGLIAYFVLRRGK